LKKHHGIALLMGEPPPEEDEGEDEDEGDEDHEQDKEDAFRELAKALDSKNAKRGVKAMKAFVHLVMDEEPDDEPEDDDEEGE
jgi:hypothetical protein